MWEWEKMSRASQDDKGRASWRCSQQVLSLCPPFHHLLQPSLLLLSCELCGRVQGLTSATGYRSKSLPSSSFLMSKGSPEILTENSWSILSARKRPKGR